MKHLRLLPTVLGLICFSLASCTRRSASWGNAHVQGYGDQVGWCAVGSTSSNTEVFPDAILVCMGSKAIGGSFCGTEQSYLWAEDQTKHLKPGYFYVLKDGKLMSVELPPSITALWGKKEPTQEIMKLAQDVLAKQGPSSSPK